MQREEVLVAALRAAAKEIHKYDPSEVETTIKSTDGDFVTAADLASEKVIIESIKTAFPDDLIISEETIEGHTVLNDKDLSELSAWVIDPIDGTNNFKHGIAYCGISIGYIKKGKISLGGILDLYRDLLYIAKPGEGATCNGRPIHVANLTSFTNATRVCTGNSYAATETQTNLKRFFKLGEVWVDVLGSAVLIMADVASGRLDLFYHNGLKPWDNAAGFLIAQEAGAKIVGLNGQPITWLSSEAVIGNPVLVDKFLEKQAA